MTNSISNCLAIHKRADLIQIPAIIHRLPRLSLRFNKEIYVLRDDLTGFGLGGNKTRKVDFLIGDALAHKATTLITIKATSFSRNAAAGAAACGLHFHVILPGTESDQNPLSQSVFAKWGAKLHYEIDDTAALVNCQESLVASLRAQGENVYVLHPGGSDTIGALSYVNAFDEIREFSERTGVYFSHIVHSTSSAGTQAGLVVGQCIASYETQVLGISASRTTSEQSEIVCKLAQSTAQLLDRQVDHSKIIVNDSFVGPGYAQASKEGEIASKVFANLEGIFLDPAYTGKAAAALLDYSENKRFGGGPVLFIHTGGNAGLYY
ncbi:pyridoxal-phosphate dependent enzyme [Desulfopila aestuarii]|uniref:D-cysteine desulfhydrase n=1 Tax=Desulfopila aestuarii DSM 18488 TaxID=1121416 RepID=A0A1M7YMP7_9BACT|nr:pyridoxal-phosphate dependent enzyme [Desulfopila aestuarii]SHO53838.1 D-cysteine desulfhydrase [Desulfopila aestuarii DSM 18488]